MSKTLAPIHYGLYKKIVLFENIERLIVEKTDREMGHTILTERFGDYVKLAPLEDIIDHNNIHGWLQESIATSEKRQAALVYALMQSDVSLLDKVKEAYYETGLETGTYFKGTTAVEIYTALNQVILDGMPCDRVSSIIDQSDVSVHWKTDNCVHQENWSSQGIKVEMYYQFREAFTKGFVKSMSESFMYKFSLEYKLHEIKGVL